MKKLFIFVSTTVLISNISFAKILRVGYNGIPLTGVDYSDIQQAQDAANAGDTLQIYGSASNGTITKKLVIMGFGYNFDEHPGLQVVGGDAPSKADFAFGAGSDGTFITGISGSFIIGDQSGNHVTVSNITFQRCYGSFTFYNNIAYSAISNIKIFGSVITGGGMGWSAIDDYAVTNLQVFNCYISDFRLYLTGTSAVFVNCVGGPNTIAGPSVTANNAGVLIRNCIFGYSNAALNINTIYENNFFQEAQPVATIPGNNNRWSQSYFTLFNRITSANDNASNYGSDEFDENYFTLKAGSPAINGGFNSNNTPTNCGIFGGEAVYVYKPSGVPNIPSIYKLTAPTLNTSSNPYNVTISVKSNN